MMISNGLALPSALLEEDQFRAFSNSDKDKYIQTVIKKILELNPNGITVSQITESISYLTRPTVWRHLELLSATREAYSLNMGKKTTIYYPNGKLIHPLFEQDLKVDSRLYSFLLLKNHFGNFLYIQEKEEDRLGLKTVSGGLIIPVEHMPLLMQKMNESLNEVNKYVDTNNGN